MQFEEDFDIAERAGLHDCTYPGVMLSGRQYIAHWSLVELRTSIQLAILESLYVVVFLQVCFLIAYFRRKFMCTGYLYISKPLWNKVSSTAQSGVYRMCEVYLHFSLGETPRT